MRKLFYILLFIACFFNFSCTGNINFNRGSEMNFIISSYYQDKLFFIKTVDNNIIDERIILDLTENPGRRVIRAGFIMPNSIFIVFEGMRERDYFGSIVHIRIYDLHSSNWEDVFIYKGDDNIRVIDIVNTDGFYSGYINKNRLMHIDIIEQLYEKVFEFPIDEEIVSIDCRSSENYLLINTYNKEMNKYQYYYINKETYEIEQNGFGQIFINKYEDGYFLHENNLTTYFSKEINNAANSIIIPFSNNKNLFDIISIDKDSIILNYYTTRPNIIGNILFGGKHTIMRYDYIIVELSDSNDINAYKFSEIAYRNNYTDKMLFDAVVSEN